jgi:AcrR family transcriptional regulator
LRERKQQRTRQAIVEAALTLFDEHGFDAVTVTDIAARAEVGRSTFFRYFADKQEVLFAEDEQLCALLVTAAESAAAPLAPLGTSLDGALVAARAGLLALIRGIDEQPRWIAIRARLLARHPELRARNLSKERGYQDAGVEALMRHGATRETAVLAAGVAAACFVAGGAVAVETGQDLAEAVEAAFAAIARLDAGALRASLR